MIDRIRRRSKWLFKDLKYWSKPSKYWRAQSGVAVICYHGVDFHGSLKFNSRFISISILEKQIRFFKKHFHIASITDYVSGNYPKDVFTLVLTFDDGYKNNFDHVLPLLNKLKVPATFFVTAIQSSGHDILWSDHLDLGTRDTENNIQILDRHFQKRKNAFYELESGLSLKDVCRHEGFHFKEEMMCKVSSKFKQNPSLRIYWELMTKAQIRTLKDSEWVTIGSHGHYHNNMASITPMEVEADLVHSKGYLEEAIEEEIHFLAYPDGSYTRETIELAQRIGYDYQFVVEYLYPFDHHDERVFNRVGNNPYIRFEHQTQCFINGHY